MPLKDGDYIITNVMQRNLVLLEDRNDETPLRGYYRRKNLSERWHVKDLGNGQHLIQNIGFQRYANSGTRAGLNASVEGRDREQPWFIQERSNGEYTIATTDTGKCWMLPDHELRTPIELFDVPTDKRCWWTFTAPDVPAPKNEDVAAQAMLFEMKMLPIVPFSPLRLDFIIIQQTSDDSVSNATRTIGEICDPLVSLRKPQPDTLRANIIEFKSFESTISFHRFTGFLTVKNVCSVGVPDSSWQKCRGSSLPKMAIRDLRADAAKVAILNPNVTLLQQNGQANVEFINNLTKQNINLILIPIQPTFYNSDIFRELQNLSFEVHPFEQMGEFSHYVFDYNEMSALPRLLEYPKLREAIIRDLPHLTKLLKGGDYGARSPVVEALSKLAVHAELRDMIHQAMPNIMKVLKGEDHDVPSATVTALSKHGELSKPGDNAADGLLKEEFHEIEAIPMDSSGRTPLSWAAGSGYDEVVRLLLVLEEGVDAKDNNGQTPLSWAAEGGHNEAVKLLLAQDDVDPNSKSRLNDTPLIWAASKGYSGVVQLLLDHERVDFNIKQNDGLSPISVAARAGHNEVVRLLLKKGGIEVDSKDKAGRTPLSHAAEEGHDEVVKLLLARKGVDANSKSKSNDTPLMWAAYKGHSRVVKRLLAHKGVNVDVKNYDGRTPLSLADDGGHDEVKKLLEVRIRQRSGI